MNARIAPGARLDELDDLVRRVRVTRQGVYDARRQLVAYRAMFTVGSVPAPRTPGASAAPVGDSLPPTTQAVAAAFGTFGVDALTDGKPLFARLPRPFVTGVVPVPAEPAVLVVDLGPHTFADAELLGGLTRLRRRATASPSPTTPGTRRGRAATQVADFVSLPVTALPSLVVPGLVAACRAARRDPGRDRGRGRRHLRTLPRARFRPLRGPLPAAPRRRSSVGR